MIIPIILSTGSLFNYHIDSVMSLAVETGFDGLELMVDWRRETRLKSNLQDSLDFCRDALTAEV